MKKQIYLWLALVFTGMLIILLNSNTGHNPVFGNICYAQESDQVKEEIFREADDALQKAEAEDVISLSPGNYLKAIESYQEALNNYEAGESLDKVREILKRTMEYIGVGYEKAEQSRIVLKDLIKMREEAKALEIPGRAAHVFAEAENTFREAAMKVEDGDPEAAKSIASGAETGYRAAAVEALGKFVLPDALQKLKDTESAISGEAYQRAIAELDKVRNFIEAQGTTDLAIGELSGAVSRQIQQALAFADAEPGGLNDLVIEGLTLGSGKLRVGEDAVIRASVRNAGTRPADGVTIRFLTSGDREIGSVTLGRLEPEESKEVSVTATIPRLDEYAVTVRVDSGNLIAGNNVLQQSFTIESIGASIWRYIISSIASALFSGTGAIYYGGRRKRKRMIRDAAFKVTGRVLDSNNSPLSNVVVRVFDKRLRSEVLLGGTNTDQAGNYAVEYAAEQFYEANRKQLDIFVRAFDGGDQEVASSRTIYNAQKTEELDLTVGGQEYRETSEYQQLMDIVAPLLQGVNMAELTEQDTTFLANRLGVLPQWITYLAQSIRLGEQNQLLPEMFYGLFRQNLPEGLSALSAQSPEVLRNALGMAVNSKIISAAAYDSVDAAIEWFQRLAIDYTLETPELLPSGMTSLADLLNTVQGITTEQQKELLKSYTNRQGSIEDFWENLRENTMLREKVDAIQETLQLGALSQNHLPLIEKLKEPNQDGKITSLQDLARLDVGGWLELINTPVPGAGNKMLMFDIDLVSESQGSLDSGSIPEELKQGFMNNGLSLSDNASISRGEAGSGWLIADGERTYNVYREQGNLNVYSNIVGAPPNLQGKNGAEKIRNYAKTMPVILSAILTNKIGIDRPLSLRSPTTHLPEIGAPSPGGRSSC